MIDHQKDLFELDENAIYLNCAYMSPQLKEVTQMGIKELSRKCSPNRFIADDFFKSRRELKDSFARLLGVPDSRGLAIIPSVSYGIASVANNINIESGDEIVVCEAQFPSHIYSWQNLAVKSGGKVVSVSAPALEVGRALRWNQALLDAINERTRVVAVPNVHWADGTQFDLLAIRKRANEVGAKLIIDGTQSIGALSFDFEGIRPDALVCAGYKWLMGGYGLGMAYYSEQFWDGEPIEHNWINRYKSEEFSKLTEYQDRYQPGAERYSVGESSNFILTAMLKAGIDQTVRWGQDDIQEYCHHLTKDGVEELRSRGCFIETADGRAHHLMGIYLEESMDMSAIKTRLIERNISVSYRGNAIRISPHVYNTREEFDRFVDCIH